MEISALVIYQAFGDDGKRLQDFPKAKQPVFYEVCHHLQSKPLPQQGIIASFQHDVNLYNFY